MPNVQRPSVIHAPLYIYSTTISLGDADFSTTMDSSFFSHLHNWTNIEHVHSYHELFVLTSGSSVITIQGVPHTFEQYDTIVIPQGVEHCVVSVDEDTRLYSMGMVFVKKSSPATNYKVYQSCQGLTNASESFVLLPKATALIDLIEKIRGELFEKRLGFMEQVNAYLSILYVSILRQWQGIPLGRDASIRLQDLDVDSSAFSPENRKQYDEMIMNNWFFRCYMDKLTVEDIALSLNKSISQTNRYIRELYGMGFVQKITQVRMNVAQRMLTETERSTEQIAELVGYSSYKGFFVAFKKYTGLTPIDFRQSPPIAADASLRG